MNQPQLNFMAPRKARDMMADSLDWIAQNPNGWRLIVDSARRDVAAGNRVRIKRYIEDLRDSRFVSRQLDKPFKLPNAYSAPFGRILAAWYPELAEYIPMAHSKTDGCIVPPAPMWARHL